MPTLEEKQLAGTPRALFLHPGGDDLAGRMEYCLRWGAPMWETDWEEASWRGKASACMQAIFKHIWY